MCFGGGGGSSPPPVQQAPAPPPPPAQQAPRAVEVDPNTRNSRENASTTKSGTSIFRNDLTIPTAAAPTGSSGLNIPKA